MIVTNPKLDSTMEHAMYMETRMYKDGVLIGKDASYIATSGGHIVDGINYSEP